MDLKALGENLGLEEDEFIEIVEIFLEAAYADVRRMEEAFRSRNTEEASEAAHSLKGSAANLGFMEIADLAAELEAEARKKSIAGVDAAIPLFEKMLGQIKDSI
jgi:HPt (histidine-containing phosphotransfer) domain-containing protein